MPFHRPILYHLGQRQPPFADPLGPSLQGHNRRFRLAKLLKLPRWFKIDTPIGQYNPDWAFVTERDERLYFVRETKSTLDSEERRTKENQKIHCGRRHFEVIGANFDVVTSLAEVGF